VRADRQTEIAADLIDMLRTGSDTGNAVFLIGHSMGAVLALHMAASARAGAIAGLDISGLPFVFDEALADTSAPRVELAWQRASGHNISLHHVARAYHLRAIAFFDEALRHA
jgi:pimeloyl-ACP methyl ester carboxylesterase